MRVVYAFVLLIFLCCEFVRLSECQLLSSLMDFVNHGQRNAAIEDLDEKKDGKRSQFDFIIGVFSCVSYILFLTFDSHVYFLIQYYTNY